MTEHKRQLTIGVVAKYLDNQDTYMSVFEALRAAGWAHDIGIQIEWIDAEALEHHDNIEGVLEAVDGILVPGGFGSRGVEGKIRAATYALENNKPYLGLCLGMQVAVVAAARKAGLKGANSAEFDAEAEYKVISTMDGQHGKENTGGTMRLGDYACKIAEGSLAAKLYGAPEIIERHRHRYECNNDFRDEYESWGIRAVGFSPDHHLVEMVEAINHPFFIASQFHPEFKSRPNRAHPLFAGFVGHLQKITK